VRRISIGKNRQTRLRSGNPFGERFQCLVLREAIYSGLEWGVATRIGGALIVRQIKIRPSAATGYPAISRSTKRVRGAAIKAR
jgi:hypothetical protein